MVCREILALVLEKEAAAVSIQWETAFGQEMHLQFARAAGKILAEGSSGPCPLCEKSHLRFYCHKFDAEKNRGTIWVWCPRCKKWDHLSRLVLDFSYLDPYAEISGAA